MAPLQAHFILEKACSVISILTVWVPIHKMRPVPDVELGCWAQILSKGAEQGESRH